jgi:hypothetical protein
LRQNDSWYGSEFSDILVPEPGGIPDELPHHYRASGTVRVGHDNASLL